MLKQNTKDISSDVFNKTSQFDRYQNFGGKDTNAFGSNEKRFQELNLALKKSNLPSPISYRTENREFSPEMARKKGWSLGVSRSNMNKIHIDRVQDEF